MGSRVWVDGAWQDGAVNVAAFLRGGFPSDANTGYLNEPDYPGSLTPFSGTIESDTTYSYRDFPGLGVGSSSTPVENVTFVGCRVKKTAVEGPNTLLYGDNITFSYCTFQPDVAAPPVAYLDSYQYGIQAEGAFGTHAEKLTVDHCDLWGFGNAIVVKGSTQAKPHVFTNNWIHDAAADGGSYHTDGIGSLSGAGTGSYTVIHNNTIEAVGNTNGLAYQAGVYDHFTITGNLFGGFGFTIALWAGGAGGHVFTDNTYSTRLFTQYGPLYPQTFWLDPGSVWARNRWRVPDGANWGNPLHNGWFWIPQSLNPDRTDFGGSDENFVSLTDYVP
jgi:hypothetical protein